MVLSRGGSPTSKNLSKIRRPLVDTWFCEIGNAPCGEAHRGKASRRWDMGRALLGIPGVGPNVVLGSMGASPHGAGPHVPHGRTPPMSQILWRLAPTRPMGSSPMGAGPHGVQLLWGLILWSPLDLALAHMGAGPRRTFDFGHLQDIPTDTGTGSPKRFP